MTLEQKADWGLRASDRCLQGGRARWRAQRGRRPGEDQGLSMHPTWAPSGMAFRCSGPFFALCGSQRPASLFSPLLTEDWPTRGTFPCTPGQSSLVPRTRLGAGRSLCDLKKVTSFSELHLTHMQSGMILPTPQGAVMVGRAPGCATALQAGHLVSTQ